MKNEMKRVVPSCFDSWFAVVDILPGLLDGIPRFGVLSLDSWFGFMGLDWIWNPEFLCLAWTGVDS